MPRSWESKYAGKRVNLETALKAVKRGARVFLGTACAEPSYLVQTSLPDAHGFVSLGISVDIVKAAVESARVVIAQANRHMPRTRGDSLIPIDKIDYIVEHDDPLVEFTYPEVDEVGKTIAQNAAKLINDGDTLHLGFGHIPHGVLNYL